MLRGIVQDNSNLYTIENLRDEQQLSQYKDFFTSHPLEALLDFELEVNPPKWKSDYVKEQAEIILANFDCIKHNSELVSRKTDNQHGKRKSINLEKNKAVNLGTQQLEQY